MKSVSAKLEGLGCRLPNFGSFYHDFFYRKMVRKEMQLAGVRGGQKVLHLGCGPLPSTTYELARAGLQVLAVDKDFRAANLAKNFLERFQTEGKVEVRQAEGSNLADSNLEFSPVEAIWVSLHTYPRKSVVKQGFSLLQEGGKLIYRNPRGWLRPFYEKVDPREIAPYCPFKRTEQIIGKETVVITKTSTPEVDDIISTEKEKQQTLESMAEGEGGVVIAEPPHPRMAVLGVRPGKRIEVLTRQCFNGPMVIDVEGRIVSLGRKLARQVAVKRFEAVG